jgi:hypothetical protein
MPYAPEGATGIEEKVEVKVKVKLSLCLTN